MSIRQNKANIITRKTKIKIEKETDMGCHFKIVVVLLS